MKNRARGLPDPHDLIGAAAQRLDDRAERLRLVLGDALNFLALAGSEAFEVVFVDPPYGSALVPAVLSRLPRVLARGARVYVESDSTLRPDPPWRVRRQAVAGAVHYHLMEWGDHDQGSLSGNV